MYNEGLNLFLVVSSLIEEGGQKLLCAHYQLGIHLLAPSFIFHNNSIKFYCYFIDKEL